MTDLFVYIEIDKKFPAINNQSKERNFVYNKSRLISNALEIN